MLHQLLWSVALAATLIVAAPAAWAGGPGTSGRLTVSAAISLTDALQASARAYADAGGAEISFNFAASNVLARQIVNGAPVDVFISADNAQMDLVERAGLVVAGTRQALVGNRLALVVPAASGGSPSIASVQGLASRDVKRIAIGDPEAVPAGVYARQYLERVGLWQTLLPRIVPSGSARRALAAAAQGAVDAAIVYATDARGVSTVRVVQVISGSDAPPIVYPICAIASGRHKAEASRFILFLRSQTGAGIFERHGFVAPVR